VKVGTMPHWIAATSDNRFAYVTNEKSNDVSVVDLTTSSVTATLPVGAAPRKIVIQPGAVPVGGATATAAVGISKFAYAPAEIVISAGQSVTWTNADPVDHTITSSDKLWDSGSLAPNGSFSMTFTQPGTYAYFCSIHPFIRGTVVVQ
jgi:YVTN family beta-propeller protein